MDWEVLAAERAAAGALFLDEYAPGWAHIVTRRLSMASTRDCLLAQLFGRFRDGAKQLELDDTQTLLLGFRACSSELGNNIRAFAPYYAALTKAWEREKQKRLVA